MAFGKEKKGVKCRENSDGSISCESIVRDKKTGEILGDGQQVNFLADPSNGCQPRLTGDNTMFDDEISRFGEIGQLVSKGCKKNQ
ncbi:MAG: hypothetical protein KKF48_02380 [Nanoarchaeota archaeon]|nr:hypothetical protein [Nanoarchaeota archaeon]MBU1027867.1 hypothetical protein [Nanoarchaeota archaeon]